MTTAVQTQQPQQHSNQPKGQVATISDLLSKYKGHMAALMPKHVSVERLFRVAMLVVGRNPKLGECHPATLVGCILESTRLGLEPGAGAGETWLVPFRNNKKNRMDCQLIIDYRGLIKMIKRANKEVEVVISERVCERDAFDYGIGDTGPYLHWKPAKGDRGKPTHYVAAAWTKARALLGYHVKTVEEVQAVRKRSRAGGEGPWVTDFEAMALKTVLRPLGKFVPGEATELQRGIALDERATLALPQDLGTLADPTETETPADLDEKSVPEPQSISGARPANGQGPEATPPGLKQAKFKIKRAAKTEVKRGGKTESVVAIYAAEGGAKYLCEHDVLDIAQKAQKDDRFIEALYEETESGLWIDEFKVVDA